MKTKKKISKREKEIAGILMAEYEYWNLADDDRGSAIAIGATGALANVIHAVVSGMSKKEFEERIAARVWAGAKS